MNQSLFESASMYKQRIATLKAEIKRLQNLCPHPNLKTKHTAHAAAISWNSPDVFYGNLPKIKIQHKCPDCGKQWTRK